MWRLHRWISKPHRFWQSASVHSGQNPAHTVGNKKISIFWKRTHKNTCIMPKSSEHELTNISNKTPVEKAYLGLMYQILDRNKIGYQISKLNQEQFRMHPRKSNWRHALFCGKIPFKPSLDEFNPQSITLSSQGEPRWTERKAFEDARGKFRTLCHPGNKRTFNIQF